jgi:hypothetical protein
MWVIPRVFSCDVVAGCIIRRLLMGSLADLILAESSDVPAIVASEYPLGTFTGTNADGLDPLKLAALHSVFTYQDFSDLLGHYAPIAEASTSGPWLIKLHGDLIQSLAGLAPQDYTSTAVKWASTEQVREAGWSDLEAEKFLGQVVHFAQIAVFEGKDIYLWVYS